MRLTLIFNPAAGRGRALRHIREAVAELTRLGGDVETHASASPDDMTRAAAEASRDPKTERVVVCGGDGTLHLAVREFDLSRGTLALLPLGSGDDFARVCGIPRNLRSACELVIRGTPRQVDVATANGRRYLGVAGFGFDSEVAAFAQDVRFLRGSAVYLYAILRVLPRFKPHHVLIDGTREEQIMFAAVGNSRQYGGGIRIVPDAKIDDGLLDLCLVLRSSRLQLLKTLPRAYAGTHVKTPFVETGRAPSFEFSSERPMAVYADGERLTETPVKFGLASKKLKIVAPPA